MSKAEAKKIVKKYIEKLTEEKFSFSSIYLFGSYHKGKPNKWSDIDVAVISDKLKVNREKYRFLLWAIRRKVDTRIEPHAFTVKEFQENSNPLAHRIKKTGIRLA